MAMACFRENPRVVTRTFVKRFVFAIISNFVFVSDTLSYVCPKRVLSKRAFEWPLRFWLLALRIFVAFY